MKFQDGKRYLLVKDEDDILRAMDITTEVAQEIGFPDNGVLFLKLVTEEACTNAYEYCSHSGQAGFLIKWDPHIRESLTIFIKHKGKKYKITKENKVNFGQRGRGLQLITSLMDYVEVNEMGGYIETVMQKDVSPPL